jgi:hypothetical protein
MFPPIFGFVVVRQDRFQFGYLCGNCLQAFSLMADTVGRAAVIALDGCEVMKSPWPLLAFLSLSHSNRIHKRRLFPQMLVTEYPL